MLPIVMGIAFASAQRYQTSHHDCRRRYTERSHKIHAMAHQDEGETVLRNEEINTKSISKKKRRVQFVPWAGRLGMLPHQYYSGVLHREEYKDWMQIQLDNDIQLPNAGFQDYFSSPNISNDARNVESHPINPPQVQPLHLKPIYIDEHIIVVNKPSGVLSVPGPRRHECVASLAFRYFGKSEVDCDPRQNIDDQIETKGQIETWKPLTDADNKQIDTMVVHRLDRDTSGVLMFARNDAALKQLHSDFKDKTRSRVTKKYIALVCGHWHSRHSNGIAINEGEIDLPLVRDLDRPPFMCVATSRTKFKQNEFKLKQQSPSSSSSNENRHNHPGYLRMVGKEAKPSLTTYRILSYEYLVDRSHDGEKLLPVTRVELIPVTGRTHQLRVHCAAVGHPIVGDSIYGYNGEGSPRGGLDYYADDGARYDLQESIYNYWMKCQLNRGRDNAKASASNKEECMLCLHAHQLSIFHPLTESPMMFECAPPF